MLDSDQTPLPPSPSKCFLLPSLIQNFFSLSLLFLGGTPNLHTPTATSYLYTICLFFFWKGVGVTSSPPSPPHYITYICFSFIFWSFLFGGVTPMSTTSPTPKKIPKNIFCICAWGCCCSRGWE